jgi:peptidoglycan-N-acetylglucosamine deacetylase
MKEQQVFSTMSPKRWRIVQTIGLVLTTLIVVGACVFTYSVSNPYKPHIPKNFNALDKNLAQIAADTSVSWSRHAANGCCAERQPIELTPLSSNAVIPVAQQIRAAYFVNIDEDPQSFYSLQKNMSKINMLMPDWLALGDNGTVYENIDTMAYQLLQKNSDIAVLPMLKNFRGGWDTKRTDILLNNVSQQSLFINNLVLTIKRYGFKGINLDFEEMQNAWLPNYYAFLDKLYHRFQAEGLTLANTYIPYNQQIDIKKVHEHSDILFVEILNQQYETQDHKGIAPLKWVEQWMNTVSAQVSKDKMVLCLPTYGMDWGKKGKEANQVSYRVALSIADEAGAKVKFNPATYNLECEYTDADTVPHKIFFTDAVTTFNQIRTATHYGWRGVAMHRLGHEDPRMWSFYDKDLSLEALNNGSFSVYDSLSTAIIPEDVEYTGVGGEVLDVITDNPSAGAIRFDYDKTNHIVTNEYYDKLPTSYVIEQYGKSPAKKLVLTFDDGPDKEYTPQVLDILKKAKVPAVFFVIGKNAEANPEILKRIYDEGHEIGNHTFYHPDINNAWKWRSDAELVMTRRTIESITGSSTVLFRPPYNPFTEPKTADQLTSFLLAKRHNYLIISESIDPLDWKAGIPADTILDRVIYKIEEKHYGKVILLHDAGGKREETLRALPMIIDSMRARGYEFVSLADLTGKTKAELMPSINTEQRPLTKVYRAMADFFVSVNNVLTVIFIITMVLGVLRLLIIMTFAIKQHIKDRKEKLPEFTPPLSIMVPAYNEEVGAVSTIASLLNQNYPDYEIVFIDDGSKDNTVQVVTEAYGDNPKVRILAKPNGGKASALNYGLQRCYNEFVVCIDADTILDSNALYNLVQPFSNPRVGAVAGNVRVGNEVNMLTRWQSIEYITAQNFDRMAFANLNCITVVPGAIGAFRRQAIGSVGWYEVDTLAEDCDLTVRIIRKGYTVVQNNKAVAITEAPESMQQFLKQRFRWSFGIMQAFWKNKNVLFNRHFGSLGFVAFPNMLFFGLLFPLLAPIADITLIINILMNIFKSSSQNAGGAGFQDVPFMEQFQLILLYGAFIFVDFGVSIVAFIIQKEPLWKLWALIPQRFAYRPLQYYVLYKAYKKALKGELMGWGVLKRTGSIGKVEVNANA